MDCPFRHRIRGEILLKRDPTNSVPAEVASSQPLPSLESRPEASNYAPRYRLRSFIN